MIPSPACKEHASLNSQAYVYLLQNKAEEFYVGWTTDIKRRVKEHNAGKSRYTKSRVPWELVGYEVFSNKDEAKKRERVLKRNPRMLSYFKKRALSSREGFAVSCRRSNQVMG